jgi:excisionase family DNA binding protein
MSDGVNLPNLQDHVSIKEAAQMLGLSYKTVHEYVTEGRIKAVRAADVILIPVEEIKNFKPNISGRPRTSIPLWRISPEDNILFQTSIFVRMKKDKQDAFKKRLEEIKQKKEHLFPGTIARYIVHNNKTPGLIEITLIWRSSVMPNEATRQQALEALQRELVDVVDWNTARYEDGTVLMHT